jgi:anhydro-N-acetylmuramic acid kinase
MNELYIGIMSGTSMDGIDVVLCSISAQKVDYIEHLSIEFSLKLKKKLILLQNASNNEIHVMQLASNDLAIHYAQAVNFILQNSEYSACDIAAIGCHGQTIRHQPNQYDISQSYTLQINNSSLLAELTNIDVVSNFREADIAASGNGAPLVPAFHEYLFSDILKHCSNVVVCNIGGMSNISILRTEKTTSGFDCGPGNVLMDSWIKHALNKDYDENGAWAATGNINYDLFNSLWKNPYFHQEPPKSTGRELFNINFIFDAIKTCEKNCEAQQIKDNDVQATLTYLTAYAIINDVQKYANNTNESILVICGGGDKNSFLINLLRKILSDKHMHNYTVCNTMECINVDSQHIEAMAFAWLAYKYINDETASLTSVTGAKKPKILGALYKH